MIISSLQGEICIGCRDNFLRIKNNLNSITSNSNIDHILSKRLTIRCLDEIYTITINEKHIAINNKVTVPLSTLKNIELPYQIIACTKDKCWTCRKDSNLHIMHLGKEWFNMILKGTKTVEGRLYDSKRKSISIGDCILFTYNNKYIFTYVEYLRIYTSFKEMLQHEGINKVLPGVSSIVEGVNIYRKYYSEYEERIHGVLAIGIKLL